MTLTHAPFFVGLLLLLTTALGLNSSRVRVKLKIFYADGGNPEMRGAERAHGNNIEHAIPLALLLLSLEWQGVSKSAILILGSLAVLARILRSADFLKLAPVGMAGVATTYTLELVMSAWLIALGWRAMQA